jgi:hypothetical protein
MPQHVSLWITASIQRCQDSRSDRLSQCNREMPLCCQQELHTQEFLGVLTGKIAENSNPSSMEAMQSFLLYLSVSHDSVIGNMSHSTAKMCWSTPFVYHIHALTASGKCSIIFNRSCKKKSQQCLPISKCGKTCKPAKISPAVPAHT